MAHTQSVCVHRLGRALTLALATWATGAAAHDLEQPAGSPAPEVDQGVPGTASTGPLGDIVVTATRRETALQTTPVAITALTGDTLANLGAQRVEDVARYVPGLFVQQSTFGGAAAPAIRGIGSFSLVTSASFPVAFYYDGLFQDRPFGNNLRQFDVERIEVLRGPQGVLFGRNATAGAIRIVYTLPGEELAVRARGAVGSFGLREAQVSVRGPLTDGVRVGLAGTLGSADGYGRNLFNNERVYGFDVQNLRGVVVLDPTDRLEVILRGQYAREFNTFGLKQLFTTPAGAVVPADNQRIALFENPVLGVDEFANNLPSFSRVKRRSASVETTYAADTFSVIALVGYNDSDNVSDSDTDGGDNIRVFRPVSIFNQGRALYDARSAELRFASTDWDRTQIDAGLYYINEVNDVAGSRLRFVTRAGVITSSQEALIDLARTDAYAVFGHVRRELTPALTARAGLRYTHETKEGDSQALNLLNNTPFPREQGRLSFDALTPLVGLDYQFGPATFGYSTIAKGFKSGGFATDPATGALVPFRPETVWNYEVGLKTDLLDRRLRLNSAVFYTDYTDLQVAQNLPGGGAIVNNAASARIWGVELESVAQPFAGLTLSGSLAYLSAEYRDYLYISRSPTFNLAGERLDRAPEWKGAIIAEYVVPTPLGSLALQGSYAYEDEVAFQSVPDSPVALAGPPASPPFERSRLYTRRAIELVDARIELTLPGDRLSFAVYGTNLTNTRFFGALNRLGGGTSTVGTVNAPRAFRFELSYRY